MDGKYVSFDITFCTSRCGRKDCHRHKSRMTDMSRHYSVSDLKGKGDCLLLKDQKKKGTKK